MIFIVVSHRRAGTVPADAQDKNRQQWIEWMGTLGEQAGLPRRAVDGRGDVTRLSRPT